MKTEVWNGHSIRLVEKDGEWWAVLNDVCNALNLRVDSVKLRLEDDTISNGVVTDTLNRKQKMIIVIEFGIYDAVFQSRKQESKDFKRWIYTVIKQLRQSIGLEGFQIFRMIDKEHQKAAMSKLNHSLTNPVRKDFIVANTIANKIISDKHGYPKMIKKSEMTPDMLVERQDVLDNTVELMAIKNKYHLDISVSDKVREISNSSSILAS